MATILMVEDDAPMAGLYARALEAQGHEVLIAPSIQQGLEILDSTWVDLIILDMTLPDGAGTQILDFLETSPKVIPVIIATGFSRYLKQGERNIVAATLSKPVTTSQLLQSVSMVLEDLNLREE
ncbi:MAG: response regulator [Anaerolineae bacterium]|nr:MAG: response regulator [Anaerolineae bacterium]